MLALSVNVQSIDIVSPSDKVLLVASDGIQDEPLVGLWDVGVCVPLLVGQVHLTHDGGVILTWLLHHLYTTISCTYSLSHCKAIYIVLGCDMLLFHGCGGSCKVTWNRSEQARGRLTSRLCSVGREQGH